MIVLLGSKSCLETAVRRTEERRRNASVLGFDTLEHRTRRLPDAQRLTPERGDDRGGARTSAREQSVRRGVRAVPIRREELALGVAEEILERFGHLRVVHRGVQAAQHRAHCGVGRPVLEAKRRESIVLRVLSICVSCEI